MKRTLIEFLDDLPRDSFDELYHIKPGVLLDIKDKFLDLYEFSFTERVYIVEKVWHQNFLVDSAGIPCKEGETKMYLYYKTFYPPYVKKGPKIFLNKIVDIADISMMPMIPSEPYVLEKPGIWKVPNEDFLDLRILLKRENTISGLDKESLVNLKNVVSTLPDSNKNYAPGTVAYNLNISGRSLSVVHPRFNQHYSFMGRTSKQHEE